MISKRDFGFRLLFASAALLVLLVVLHSRLPSFEHIFLVALVLSTFLTGFSCIRHFSRTTLRVLDFLYYGIAILGVIFLFETQRAERNAALPTLRLVTIESALEMALAEQAKLERMGKNPNDEIESSIDAILKGLYEDADEEFDRACEAAKGVKGGGVLVVPVDNA